MRRDSWQIYITQPNSEWENAGASKFDYHLLSTYDLITLLPSGPTEIGMARLALSDHDKDVRDWFKASAESYGCDVHIDEMGNMFAIRPGKQEGPPTYMGSHLDTQPAGGRYDGILGVLSGLAALRTIHESGIETEYPVGAVNWTK